MYRLTSVPSGDTDQPLCVCVCNVRFLDNLESKVSAGGYHEQTVRLYMLL